MRGPEVLAPCPGRVIAMADVPDPVFAEEMVGPGVAIEPDPGDTVVVSPIAGTVLKVHPHAFVVLGRRGGRARPPRHQHGAARRRRLRGAHQPGQHGGRRRPDDPVGPATLPSSADGQDMSTVVPVVVMDAPRGSVTSEAVGGSVAAGDLLFTTA